MFVHPITGQLMYTSVLRCLVKSVNANTLTVSLLENFSNAETGDSFDVAKPFELQKDSFDGLTIQNVTYTYMDSQYRTATRDSDSLTESHIIIPAYIPDSSIIFIMPVSNGAGSVEDLSEIFWIDLNASGRAWAVGQPDAPPPEE